MNQTNLNSHNKSQGIKSRYKSDIYQVKSVKAKADARRTVSQKFADWITRHSGSILFLVFNILFFVVWIIVNLGWTAYRAFDPYPFGLLTMIVSLEAIILAILVLVSQNREEKINALRDEVNLHMEVILEKKIIKILEKIDMILKKEGLSIQKDGESKEMLQPTNMEKVEGIIEKQIQ